MLFRSLLQGRHGRMPGVAGATLSLRGVEQAGVNSSPQTERLEDGAREAGCRENSCGVRGRGPHHPCGAEGGAARRWNQEGFWISGDAGEGALSEVLAVCVRRVAIEQCGDAVAVEAMTGARCRRLRGSKGGDEQKQAGEMAGAQAHG